MNRLPDYVRGLALGCICGAVGFVFHASMAWSLLYNLVPALLR